MHGIAHITFFLDGSGWLRLVFRNVDAACASSKDIMLVRRYHILARYKADQQYPRAENPIFILFQNRVSCINGNAL